MSFNNLASEWHPTKNGELTPQQLLAGSDKKVWWICSEGHEWTVSLHSRISKNTECPLCSNRQVLVGFNDVATVNPVLASEWHPTKNGALTPIQVSTGSHTKVWWLGKCGHEWETSLKGRSDGKGCPVCPD